jgi:serine/threonine-protein kinase
MERLQQIEEIFQEALQRDPAERDAYVREACHGDTELQREVASLLANHHEATDFKPWAAAESIANRVSPQPIPSDYSVPVRSVELTDDSTLTCAATTASMGFPPGAILAQRYRIVHLLGRGGMGEVYRADDLLLRQAVALKFLPPAATANDSMLSRFRNEVRTARQVSHPNVCRVYDIGEAEGLTYLSMEYVDGEDLASLLRRIGKLPQDKALEIARQLCSGLAAAHAKGVIHRDLKPANIMLDGQGHVRITDFGIAGIAERIQDIRSGTPAYMSPEQVAGKEVTARSDIYALGIVLHELLTGKRPPREHFEPGNAELDPAVERVILRCLKPDPQMRPATALSVAAALQGDDPLAAALAAGDTPSPEMVAAARDIGGISMQAAGICLASILVGLIVALVLGGNASLLQKTPFGNSPEVLAQKARDLAVRVGYTNPPVDRAYGFRSDTVYQQWAESNLQPEEYRAQIAQGQPPLVLFWYRQSPEYLETLNAGAAASRSDPPPILSGTVQIDLDPQARLVHLWAVPQQLDAATAPSVPPDWKVLFEAAGLDQSRWTPAEPQQIPVLSLDARAAWTGSYGHAPSVPMRIEAGSLRGRPVYFYIKGPWMRPGRMGPRAQQTSARRAAQWLGLGVIIALFTIAALLALRNFRLGRGDIQGAVGLPHSPLGPGFSHGCVRLTTCPPPMSSPA